MPVPITKPLYERIVRDFVHRSVLVVGDLMVDEYLRGSAHRVSPEGPVMVVEIETDEFKPGGAANVVNNLQAMGARVCVAGVVGDDEAGGLLRASLAATGADVEGVLVDRSRPTTRKTRVVAQNQQVLRIDREQTHPVSSEVAGDLLRYVADRLDGVDAVLVSDYRKGVLTLETARAMTEMARVAAKPLIANPKPSSAPWLRGASLISLNQIEAEALAGSRLPHCEPELRAFGEQLICTLGIDTMVVTQGARGLAYWRQHGEYRHVPAHPVEVYDVAGAGDTTISAMTLALACGAGYTEAAFIANHAGACVVRKAGVATVTPDELIQDWHC